MITLHIIIYLLIAYAVASDSVDSFSALLWPLLFLIIIADKIRDKIWTFKYNYLEVFTELSKEPTSSDPQTTILWYKGHKRRKLISSQYTD